MKATSAENIRGRRRPRAFLEEDNQDEGRGGENDNDSSGADVPSLKRRRSRKGLERKFECDAEGCGKSYSRAEHLYRHQLNHAPKQIFSCDFPDCDRTFVRQDLCTRHKERHTSKGSQLQCKDSISQAISPITDDTKELSINDSISPEQPRAIHSSRCPPSAGNSSDPFSPATARSSTFSGSATSSTGTEFTGHYPSDGFKARSKSEQVLQNGQDMASRAPVATSTTGRRPASFGALEAHVLEPGFSRSPSGVRTGPYSNVNEPPHQNVAKDRELMPLPAAHKPYVSRQHFAPFNLPPPGFSTTTAALSSSSSAQTSHPVSPPSRLASEYQQAEAISAQQRSADIMLLDQMTGPNTMPVFGGEGYERSPFAVPDDFLAYLFSGKPYDHLPMVDPNVVQQGYNAYFETQSLHQPFASDFNLGGFFPQTFQGPMSVTRLLDTSLPESGLSDEKSQEIIDLIKGRFNETDYAPVAKQKEALLEGNRNDGSHMMSRKMMQMYIGSFWHNFHPQLPILHKPTFSPENTPNLLLIAMMAIGASCLDKMHGHTVMKAGAELSNFLAWHLRWEVFSHVHFRPPAKLWVFQTLLLLEIYEKMYSTRALHERAHIHHATTITLMRRGSSLIGRSALDSPPSVRDDKMASSSRQSMTPGINTPDEWWNRWITNEATRRAAFAAFVIDSTHATMFGHSTVMVAHEMRLPLPCDEALWSATSSAEVGRIEASLQASEVKQISFLEGLKRTLNAQDVRTNTFGRTILMAGLLSVSWHMDQRDLQVSSLGVSQALGGRDKWRSSLTRAFDIWKQDFDRSLGSNSGSFRAANGPYLKGRDAFVLESRVVLHHLAHMAMHVNIVDCQIFARGKRLLGRTIGVQDLSAAQRRMKDHWAPTARARGATYYALRFLSSVLLPEDWVPGSDYPAFDYSARDDILLNRSWVLYFAALVVWSYGYALEGPASPMMTLKSASFEEQVLDLRLYLYRLQGVRNAEDLKSLRGLNGCGGLLLILKAVFEKTRWELLHEAANLLGNCIQLVGGAV